MLKRMAITGTHMLLYSTEPEALRAVLRDSFKFPCVDAHGGWLIFKLPPAELGVHPAKGVARGSGGCHELAFMCDDLDATMAELAAKGVTFPRPAKQESYGRVVAMLLPGGVAADLYQPSHKTALNL